MRRRTTIKPIKMNVPPSFFEEFEKKRKEIQTKAGTSKSIGQTRVLELLMRSGLKFPKINFNLLKDDKRKKR